MGTVNIIDIALMSQVLWQWQIQTVSQLHRPEPDPVWSHTVSAPHLLKLTELRVLCIVWMTLQVEDRGETHTGPPVVPHKHVKKNLLKWSPRLLHYLHSIVSRVITWNWKINYFFSLVYLFSPNLTRPTVIVFWHNTAHFNDFIIPPRCRIVNERVLFKGWQLVGLCAWFVSLMQHLPTFF